MRMPGRDREGATTELTATNAAERNALTHLAADARMLTHSSHPSLVPVLEARWLGANRLSLTRSTVRGQTLRETLDAGGPMQESRVVEVLREVGGVLDWAARGNIVHRHVASDSVCFEHRTGRVLVQFGLPPGLGTGLPGSASGSPALVERCADGATLARLAYEMLTAHQAIDASAEALRVVRPDVSAGMASAIDAALGCAAGAPQLGARQFLALLPGGDASAAGATAIAVAASAPVVPRGATVPLTPPAMPLATPVAAADLAGQGASPVAPATAPEAPPLHRTGTTPPSMHRVPPAGTAAPRRKGRGMLAASLLALIILIGSTFALIQRDRSGRSDSRVAAVDRDTEAAGDVTVGESAELPPDPGGLTTSPNAPATSTPLPTDQDPSPATELPSSLPSNLPAPLPRALPPAPPGEVRPSPVQAPAPVPPTTPEASTEGGCASTAIADQRDCLSSLIAGADGELTSVYQALLRAVRERDGEAAVEDVRAGQRAWLERRDRACRSPAAVDGQPWARERAECFARQSDARALELARALAAVRNGT